MGWINPLYEEHQRKRWLRNDAHLWVRQDAHRFVKPSEAEAKACAAQAEAALAEQEAFQRELLHVRRDLADLKLNLALGRLNFKYEGQPRDERGRWGEGRQGVDSPKDPGLTTKPAFLLAGRVAIQVGRVAVQKGVEAALTLFAARSARNTSNSTAALEFNASAFEPGPIREQPWIANRQLTKEEVEEFCPKRKEVQKILDEVAPTHKPEDYPTASARGTAIHAKVAEIINGPGRTPKDPIDHNFRAETSLLASELVDYGTKESKRLDVFENPGKGTVCIHDEKTGKATLSFPEMARLVAAAYDFYPEAKRIIVTEVRPSK